MKKIMFSDKYGLTQAVLDGRKTMTRRIVKDVGLLQFLDELNDDGSLKSIKGTIITESNSPYKIGEIVAVAQSYKDVYALFKDIDIHSAYIEALTGLKPTFGKDKQGYANKMFVKAEFMPHHIRITDIKVERLQDISDDDCMKEGIYFYNCGIDCGYTADRLRHKYGKAKDAFAALIDLISGKGTWDRNPYVFAYTFELVEKGGGDET